MQDRWAESIYIYEDVLIVAINPLSKYRNSYICRSKLLAMAQESQQFAYVTKMCITSYKLLPMNSAKISIYHLKVKN